MKHFLSVLIVSLLCVLPAGGQRMTQSQYIEKFADIAVREMKATGIPASITLAQGCLESGNGNSTLAREANNHFGIKCHRNWKGKSVRHDDDEKGECFRKYASADESYRDHSDFLRYRDRYASLFNLDPGDYKGWAYGLQKAGYATAPTYAASLIRIIEENNLQRFDKLDRAALDALPPTPSEAEYSILFKPHPGHKLYTASLYREIHSTNGVAYIIAQEGDSYGGLAREYKLFRSELLRFNDRSRDEKLMAGEKVYLEAKKNESARNLDKHVVEEGETMRDLAQRYAVKMKKIYKYNSMRPGTEPEAGTILNLRKPR